MRKLIVLLIFSMLCASASAAVLYYEDFETPGSEQMTLNDGQTVSGGYLSGYDAYPLTFGLLDGTYAASPANPITIETTYNMLTTTYSWASIAVAIGTDSAVESPTGLVVTFHHQTGTYGGLLQVQGVNAGIWGTNYQFEGPWEPAGYDPALDYKLTIVDYGTSLDVGLEEVGNPANNISTTGIDISGYVRAGDGVMVGNFYNTYAGIDDVTIIPEPATMVLLGLGGLLLRRKRA